MPVCGPSLFGENNSFIKFGNLELLAIDGSNIFEKMNLSGLRMPYKQIAKSRVILKPGQENFLLNYSGIGDNVTFLAIKAEYNSESLEEYNYINWMPYNNIDNVNTMSQFMLLTGNSEKRIPQLFLSNPNSDYEVKLEIMMAVIDDSPSFYNYKPVVYFNDLVTLETTQYTSPYNTSVGDNFGATLSFVEYGTLTFSKTDLISILIDEVRDSNGVTMSLNDDNYILYDDINIEIDAITISGTYSINFDITDSMNNSIDPVDKINIIIFP